MTNATQGRRPTGPGAYVYRGKHVERIVLVWETYGPVVTYAAAWIADGERRITTTDDMPGEFVPLAKPPAAPEPVITPEILDTIEDAILIGDDDSIGTVWEWIGAQRKEVRSE